MGKQSFQYLETSPNSIIEKGFHKDRNQVSESLFSLGNEYCGVRGFLEEGSSLPSLIGTYFNGIIEYGEEIPNAYKGIAKRSHFTINSCNFLKIDLLVNGIRLDLASAEVSAFLRTLDFKTGLMSRSFVWHLDSTQISLKFERILGMSSPKEAIQRIHISADRPNDLTLVFHLDGLVKHWGHTCYYKEGSQGVFEDGGHVYQKTLTTHQGVYTAMKVDAPFKASKNEVEAQHIALAYEGKLEENKEYVFTRFIVNEIDKTSDETETDLKKDAEVDLLDLTSKGFDGLLKENEAFFEEARLNSDIEIEGDDSDQQGIRFCLFNLLQAYVGLSEDDNIGAKGLTGEAYSGHAFWDSETYCLPYYLFTNPKAAKDLLLFRYHTLEQAKARAKDLDCDGACYPIATRTGEEACTLWQHASTQLQPTTGVAYAIRHYMNLYEDENFMKDYGLEMLLEIGKFLLTRGQWNADGTHFGYYGVMGPDEFQVMVNHNTYTNWMGKKTMEYVLSLVEDSKYKDLPIVKQCGYDSSFVQRMKEACSKTLILFDPKTKLFEQHQGYYDLPHIDVDAIPVTDFPLYSHWSYDRIYRNDMIKQPDVLMFLFLHPQDFDKETIKANYEFYEPRCIHESSLSPSVHSILAEEIGNEEDALKFFGFATRLDLDDYNRNTCEGLHMTSIAAAWVNIVYGFLGVRSESGILKVSPKLPKKWKSYSVRLFYRGAKILFKVEEKGLRVETSKPVAINVYGETVSIEGERIFPR
ncbi:MAG: glycoside hydrolase family 65 protein [Candidatus Enteromonas sp.]